MRNIFLLFSGGRRLKENCVFRSGKKSIWSRLAYFPWLFSVLCWCWYDRTKWTPHIIGVQHSVVFSNMVFFDTWYCESQHFFMSSLQNYKKCILSRCYMRVTIMLWSSNLQQHSSGLSINRERGERVQCVRERNTFLLDLVNRNIDSKSYIIM